MTERALAGRAIVVLGATGGLGRAVTERFRADGASVLAFDARIPAAQERQDQVEYVAVDALDETIKEIRSCATTEQALSPGLAQSQLPQAARR